MNHPAYSDYYTLDSNWGYQIPLHWKSSRLKFDSYIKARVGWHGLKSDEFTDEGPYLITGTDFQGAEIDWNASKHCTIERYDQDKYIQLKDGDILVTKDGTIGKVLLINKLPGKACLNSGIFVLRPLHTTYISRFYFWLIKSDVFTDFIEYHRTGSTILHLYQETFSNFKYALPPLDEQSTIAAFLDHETSKIDTLIAKQERLIELLKEKRQAVISHAVTKGLDPDVSMKDSGVEWLGEVPAHWSLPKLFHKTSRIGDGLHSTPEYEDDTDYYFVNGNNLKDGEIFLGETAKQVPLEEYLKHQVPLSAQTVLISINGTIGNTALYGGEPVILGKSAAYINCIGGLSRDYLMYFLQSDQALHYYDLEVTGTTIFNLSLNSIRNMSVSLPPLEEQKKITDYCAKSIGKYDELIAKTAQALSLVKERRTALISAAVTGKIDVRDWEPESE